MNRNSWLLLTFTMLVGVSVFISALPSTSAVVVRGAEQGAGKNVTSERLCGRGQFDVCDWRVRERRSNY